MAAPERKRSATASLDSPPSSAAKRVRRLTPCAGEAAAQRPLALDDPPDALVFPDPELRELEKANADALAARITRAAREGGGAVVVAECSGAIAEHVAASTRDANARSRASWVLGMIEAAVAEREAARMRAENAALREQAAAVERDTAALARAVLAKQVEMEELELALAATRKKVAEPQALRDRMRGPGECRFQAHLGPDVL